jgi:protein-S-isoprenylcysteine O-methyltransferase Ste14
MSSGQRRRQFGNYLVAAQFGLIGLCLLPVGPTIGSGQGRPLGMACLVLALVIGGLALLALGSDARVHPVPDESAALHTNGIYAFIRHPMYAAVLLACLGVTLSSGRALSLLALIALAGVLHVKAQFEDRLLEQKFGWQFAVYASHVPAVVPQPWRSHRR